MLGQTVIRHRSTRIRVSRTLVIRIGRGRGTSVNESGAEIAGNRGQEEVEAVGPAGVELERALRVDDRATAV